MIRTTRIAGSMAFAAALFVTISSAEGSGAFAQQGENEDLQEQPLTAETVPAFVAQEVVQPLPDAGAEAAEEFDIQNTAQAESLADLVADTRVSGDLSREMKCLAGAIYFEARGEPLEGQLAVAKVIINRANSSVFPSSYCGVVTQRSQFSFVKGGRMPSPRKGTNAWTRAKSIARIAHEGLWDSEAGESLYFHANYVRPSWSRRKVAQATINRHIFYK